MKFNESRTVEATEKLRDAYPYAAALLSYVALERVLKRYVFSHWKDFSLGDSVVPRKNKRHAGKKVSQLQHLTEHERLNEPLCEMTLGEVEGWLKRKTSQTCARDRNDLMHSNIFLQADAALPRMEQQARNRLHCDRAYSHLTRAMDQFEGSTHEM